MKLAWLVPLLLCGVAATACGDDDFSDGGVTSTSSTGATTSSASGMGGSGTGGASASSSSTTGSGGAGGMVTEIGMLSGMCGELDPAELTTGSPAFKIDNEIDFGMMAMMTPDPNDLPPDTKKVHDDGNLGGSSLWSEVFAYEVLRRCEMATLLKTEGEIVYQDDMGKKTDLLVEINGAKIGVSVTRAFKFPPTAPYTVADAQALLQDKLADIPQSTANVSAADAWQKQILHVLAYAPEYVMSLQTAYGMLDNNTKGDTIVVVTLTSGDDAFVY